MSPEVSSDGRAAILVSVTGMAFLFLGEPRSGPRIELRRDIVVEHLYKNWPVYILLAGFVWLVISILIASRKEKQDDARRERSDK